MIESLKYKLLKNGSFRKTVLYLVIIFTIIFAVSIAVLTSITLYKMKINNMSYNQSLFLNQVKHNAQKLIDETEKTSLYIKNNYRNKELIIENIININSLINTVVIFKKDGSLESLYSSEKKNFFGVDGLRKEFLLEHKRVNKESYWSNVFISQFNNKAYVSYNFRVKDNIVALLVSLDNFTLLTEGLVNNDKSFMIRIFDKKGSFILNQDKPDLVRTRFNASKSEVYNKLIDIKKEYELAKFTNICFGNLDYGMYANIEKTHWKIVVRQDYLVIQNYLFNLVAVIIATVLLFTIIAIYITKRFLNNIFISLEKFERQTSNISNGNYTQTLEPTYFKEFSNLFTSFEKMREEINLREETLKQSLKNFKTLVNSTMEGILIHDEHSCIDINDIAVKLLSYKKKEEVIGKDIYKLLCFKHKKDFINFFRKQKVFSKPREYEILTEDKKIITVLAQGRMIKYKGKDYRISVFLDITNMKNQQKILLQQSKIASLGEMLSNIAHQWRQPLSAIRTISTGIKLEKELGVSTDEKIIENLDKIDVNTQYLSKTIDAFSNYFNPNKEVERFDLCTVINKTLSLLEPTFKEYNIEVIVNNDEEIYLSGYPNELIQALINILNNSKDALLLNDIKHKVIFIDCNSLNNKVTISIKDSGLGIKNSKLSKIFEPYFTTKHKSQGTGVGLYMTHQIVKEQMKGTIYAKNISFEYKNKHFEGLEIIIEFNSIQI